MERINLTWEIKSRGSITKIDMGTNIRCQLTSPAHKNVGKYVNKILWRRRFWRIILWHILDPRHPPLDTEHVSWRYNSTCYVGSHVRPAPPRHYPQVTESGSGSPGLSLSLDPEILPWRAGCSTSHNLPSQHLRHLEIDLSG